MTMTPLQWISGLSNALGGVSCRVRGKAAPAGEALEEIKSLLVEIKKNNKAVYWVGNGGSLGLCSHLSQDVLNKLQMRSYVLSDASLLTCMANDFGYEAVYARPLDVLMHDGDLLIAVSSSGNSQNILNAADVAKKKGARCVALSAFKPTNQLNNIAADVSIYLPCELYGHAEVGHEAILHSVIETLWLETKSGK